jgi:signal transduction histidine kinase/putative methionine-R-sulfoxide reductase with GAF domain
MERNKLLDRLEFLHDRVMLLERRFECITKIASALGSSLQLVEVLPTIAEQVTNVLDADRATVFLVNDETQLLEAKTIIGPGMKMIVLRPGQGVAGWVAQTGKTLNIKDAYKDKRFDPTFDYDSGYRTKSILCQPMVSYQGKIVGVIQVLNKQDGYFTVGDEHLLSTITTQATIFIQNSKYYTQLHDANMRLTEAQENLKRNYGRMETLYNIQTQMTQTWERTGLLKGVLKEISAAIPCGLGAILISVPAPPALYIQRRNKPEVEVHEAVLPAGLLGTVLRDRKSLCDGDNGGSLMPVLHPVLDVDVTCLVAEPLIGTDGEPLGVIALANRAGLLKFTAEDAQIMKIIARQIVTAMERLDAHDTLTRENNLALIGSALGGVIHDFKSPMGIIAGYVQLMAEEEDPSARQEKAEQVLAQFKHVNSMTQEVLAFARGEATVFKRSIYSQKFFAELEPLLLQEFAGYNIKLQIENHIREKFKADEGKLKRLFFNIARNARDAMPEGGQFRLEASMDDGQVQFNLSDTGHGIPESIRPKLFQSFVTTGKKDGTGLGLAIVKSIVEQHNGTVQFSTDTGRGTSFIIRLPKD